MTKITVNIKQPTGKNVIRSASGRITHVAKPLGAEATRTLVTRDVMKRAAEARKAANID